MSSYKTTITFKGRAKDFIIDLEQNKSVIISNLIAQALKDGSMITVLEDQLPKKIADKLAQKHCGTFNISCQNSKTSISKKEVNAQNVALKKLKETESASLSEFDL